jgi:D-amino-acid dehydrogenase
VVPLASPGIIQKGLKWLLRNDSPFYIKPRLNLELMHWGWLFNKHANSRHVKKFAPILANLNNSSRDLYLELGSSLGNNFSHSSKGLLMLFQTSATKKEELEAAELAQKVGIDTQILSGDEVSGLDNGTSYNVKGAVYYPGDAFLDPGILMRTLEEKLIEKGVNIKKGVEISSLEFGNGMITGAHSNDSSFEADEFVISAGVYSSILAKKLGIYLPMQGGKGYSVTIKKPESLPEICSILVESRVAVTPMSGNLRLAGTMEIAGLDQSISKNRVNGYLKSVENYLPDFKYEKMDYKGIWVGLRPCSPDGIPYIGRTKKYKNLIFATGHSMMGLSLGPVSGKIISDIVSNRNDFPDLNQLTPDRFN